MVATRELPAGTCLFVIPPTVSVSFMDVLKVWKKRDGTMQDPSLLEEAADDVSCLRRIFRKLTFYEAREVKRRVIFERQALANALEPRRYTCVDIGDVPVIAESKPQHILNVGKPGDVTRLDLPPKLPRRLGDTL